MTEPHSLLDVFEHPADASVEDVLKCWTVIQKEGGCAFAFLKGNTFWHVIASWSDYDWMKFELTVRRLTHSQTAFECWLDAAYSLNDEFVANDHGETPQQIARKNTEWPYLLDWWAFKRQTLEHAQLAERYPEFQLELDLRAL